MSTIIVKNATPKPIPYTSYNCQRDLHLKYATPNLLNSGEFIVGYGIDIDIAADRLVLRHGEGRYVFLLNSGVTFEIPARTSSGRSEHPMG